ncbi:MAG: SIMPL domain-containing protein [Rhodobacteraceae bacterium]|nr:SIMPL domain-containing protein [Paracoccaceae bacterium]
MKQSLFSVLASVCVTFAVFAGVVQAQQSGEIVVTGTGEVSAAPDMAVIRLGVSHRSDSAQMAMEQVNDGAARLLRRITARGVEPRDVQTGRIGLQPVRGVNSTSGLGSNVNWDLFEASAMLTIRLRDASILGDVMQELLEVGGNQIFGLSFGLQEPDPFEQQARLAAVRDAQDKANQLAEAAGVTLGPLLELTEHGNGGSRPMMEMAASARSDAMPVALGAVDVRVSVHMRFAIQ